jgi:hypothetical protein
MKDWRDNIKGIDSLSDLDPTEVMIYLRHQYLETAKDLILCKGAGAGDIEFGNMSLNAALGMQQAIDELDPYHDINEYLLQTADVRKAS